MYIMAHHRPRRWRIQRFQSTVARDTHLVSRWTMVMLKKYGRFSAALALRVHSCIQSAVTIFESRCSVSTMFDMALCCLITRL